MIVDVIDNFEDFKKVNDNWDCVYDADPEAQFFLSWTWLSEWLLTVRRHWFILAAKPAADASYVAFLPLRLRTKLKPGSGFFNEISMAGNSGADYTGLLCLRGSQYQAIPALARFLKTLNWTRLRLDNIRISEERLRLLLAHFPERAFTIAKAERTNKADHVDNCICPLLNLPDDWDGYLSALSANTRQKIRRFLRMVENDNKFRITHAQADTLERDVDTLLKFWSARWGLRKGDRLNAMLASSRTILHRCFDNGCLFLPILWHEEAALAALAIYVDRCKASLLFFMGGRDESVQSPPPGLILHAHSIRYAIANGFSSYDFLRGNEAYKYSFGAEERRIHCLVIGTKTGRNLGETLAPRSLPAVLQHAAELHRRGNLAEAERGYRQILAVEPAHQAALQGLNRVRVSKSDQSAPAIMHRQLGPARLA
jgi:CelD/BcsL family acetyltransferase involved in cellulose biosynthesis